MKGILLLVILFQGNEVIPGGGERRSEEYLIKQDRISIFPSGETRGREYRILSGPRRFLESATPVIYFVIPSEVDANRKTEVGIGGEGFLSYPSPPQLFIGKRKIMDFNLYGSTAILFTYPGDMSEGIYDVKVINNDGKMAVKERAFRVKKPSLEIYSVIPSVIEEGERRLFSLSGKNFQEGLTLSIGIYPVEVSKVTEDLVEFYNRPLTGGIYDIHAFNPDGISATLRGAIQVVRGEGTGRIEGSGGCGCSSSGSSSFIYPLFLLPFFLRKRLSLLLSIIFLSCGGNKENRTEVQNSPPVASAGSDITTEIFEWIRLNGKGSHDPDGDEVEFLWRVKASPEDGVYYFFDRNTPTPLFMAETPGEYQFELVLHDGEVFSSPDYVTVNVKGDVEIPVPCASVITEGIGGILQLDGGCSYDPNGEPLIYEWKALSSPECQQMPDIPPIPNPVLKVECPSGTLYRFSLTVSDGRFSSSPLEITTIIPNSPPVLSDIPDMELPSGSSSFQLSSGEISDPDGDILSCKWRVEKSPSGANVVPNVSNACSQMFSITGSTDGYYLFLLEVSDGKSTVKEWVNVAVGKPLPPQIVTLSADHLISLEENFYTTLITAECIADSGSWTGSPSFVKFRWEVYGFPEDVTFSFLTPPEGWLTGFSAPLTAVIELKGKIRNMEYPVVKGNLSCTIMGFQEGFPFVSEREEFLAFTLPNVPPSVFTRTYIVEYGDEFFQHIILKARGEDREGDILSSSWSLLSIPEGAIAYLSGSFMDEACLYAGGEKRGVYLLRVIVRDEHGATGYSDFSVVIR